MKHPLLLTMLTVFAGWHVVAVADFSVEPSSDRVVLQNGTDIRAIVVPEKGGELSSLRVLFNDEWHELLYRALDYTEQPGWRGKAPLLWPATGISIIEHSGKRGYELQGSYYDMPLHGFARSLPWRMLDTSQSAEHASVILGLSDTEKSRQYYPFGFELQVEYRLDKEKLSLVYRVSSNSENQMEMPFSIGNHITFKAPLISGSSPADLEFENKFPHRLLRGENKAFSGAIEPSAFIGRHDLASLPRRNAVSLGGETGLARLSIHDPAGLRLELRHQSSGPPTRPAIQFNLWADIFDGFFSPEPWVGAQNSLNNGAGLVRLQPGQSWQWKIDIIPGTGPVEN